MSRPDELLQPRMLEMILMNYEMDGLNYPADRRLLSVLVSAVCWSQGL